VHGSDQSRGSTLPLFFAVIALGLQFVLVLFHNERPLTQREVYFSGKASYFDENGSLPKAGRRERDREAGHLYGASDWRPPGYPVALSAIGGGAFSEPRLLRVRVLAVQFALTAVAVLVLLQLLCRDVVSTRFRWIAAIALAAVPFPFEFVSEIAPDTLAAVLVVLAFALVWRWIAKPAGAPTFFFAMLAASLPLLLRPELIAFAPLLAIAAFVAARRVRAAEVVAALLAIGLAIGAQAAYRKHFIGHYGLYGAYRTPVSGAVDWTRTWLGTEKEGLGLVDELAESRVAPVPERAWGDANERKTIEEAFAAAARDGYGRNEDEAFASVAQKRRREHGSLVLLVRALNPVQLWIHNATGYEIGKTLEAMPHPLQRPLRMLLIILRIAAVVLGIAGIAGAFGRWLRRTSDAADALTLTMAVWIAGITILAGLVLDWRIHRLVQTAWLPMLWCAAMAFRPKRVLPARTAV
jgi:hypothetical protein